MDDAQMFFCSQYPDGFQTAFFNLSLELSSWLSYYDHKLPVWCDTILSLPPNQTSWSSRLLFSVINTFHPVTKLSMIQSHREFAARSCWVYPINPLTISHLYPHLSIPLANSLLNKSLISSHLQDSQQHMLITHAYVIS